MAEYRKESWEQLRRETPLMLSMRELFWCVVAAAVFLGMLSGGIF